VVGTVVYAAVQYDFLPYILNYWFSPALVVGLALGLFFDYLPHRRLKNAIAGRMPESIRVQF
jgi:beta-carotene hydroxylase